MKNRFASLEEAHPRVPRVCESQMAGALVKALKEAARRGRLHIPVPSQVRAQVLSSKTRHSFGG